MDKFLVKGKTPLKGEVQVSGAKNAALPIMAASLLADGEVCLRNIPSLGDVRHMASVLETLGASVHFSDHKIYIDPTTVDNYEAPYNLVRKMRASIYVMGPLLATMKKAYVSQPGGCAIGQRPIDQHLKAFEALGAKIELKHGYIKATTKGLTGASVYCDVTSVGATANMMMAAVMAQGETVIGNAACEPEIVDLANFLKNMGAKIEGAGTDTIKIKGVKKLKACSHTIIPDRIEAGTFILAGLITGGDIVVKNMNCDHLESFEKKLAEAGVELSKERRMVHVVGNKKLKPVDVKTLPYPGFPTDLQAQIMVLLATTKGTSTITETIWENRFMHVSELNRLGADIRINGNSAIIEGVSYLSGAPVMCSDLRASAALVLAAIAAEGTTEVLRVYHIDRGYESIENKLNALGANIIRTEQ